MSSSWKTARFSAMPTIIARRAGGSSRVEVDDVSTREAPGFELARKLTDHVPSAGLGRLGQRVRQRRFYRVGGGGDGGRVRRRIVRTRRNHLFSRRI